MRRRIHQISGLLFPAPERPGPVEIRPPFEQFAVPHQFQPRLTLGEAVVSVFLALVRIFSASLLFAAWGAYSFLTWNAFQNSWGRGLLLILLLLVFLAALGAVMIAINLLGRASLNKRRRISV